MVIFLGTIIKERESYVNQLSRRVNGCYENICYVLDCTHVLSIPGVTTSHYESGLASPETDN